MADARRSTLVAVCRLAYGVPVEVVARALGMKVMAQSEMNRVAAYSRSTQRYSSRRGYLK